MPTSPQSSDRKIRVFISSTFRDMQEERDILIKKVFPQLRKLCEERAVTWTEVDLRWGITTEQAAEGKVLPLCLEEIHRCRPYFIGLLGGRYGWVPEPDSIPADLLESQPWLKQHLDRSVTELEILHGVFSEEPMHGHAYFYFRDPRYLESIPSEKRQDFTAESADGAEKLEMLKQKIRGACAEQVCELRENYANPEQLGEWILEDFTKLIHRLYPKDQTPDPLDQEAGRHEAYARSRRLAFVGRDDMLRRLNDHCAIPGKPLVLTGESGCGKSALLAEWAARWREGHPDDLIIQHYIGSTPDSADWQGLVRRILSELKRAFAITDEIPIQPDALRGALNGWAMKAAGLRRFVLVLDALNQLADDGAARQLGWLPVVFPANFRLLVSSLPGESLDALRKRGWPELNVPLFARADITPAALAYFKIFSKTPPPDLVAKLESTPAASNALYLRAVLDELRQFGKHEELRAKAADYLSAPDLPELFDRILTRWHDDFGQDPDHPDLVRRSLCFIACARFGLSESELLDLLGKNAEPLPHRPWTPFYLAAENALALRTGLLNFGHDYLRAAVQKRWLEEAGSVHVHHLELARYFGMFAESSDRRLAVFPWHLQQAQEWQLLVEYVTDIAAFARHYDRRPSELARYWISLPAEYDMQEKYIAALSKWEASETDPLVRAEVVHGVAMFLQQTARYDKAVELYRKALEIRLHALGMNDPETVCSFNNLAGVLTLKGDYAAAERLYQQALETFADSPSSAVQASFIRQGLAWLLYMRGDYANAEALYRQALTTVEKTFGAMHPQTVAVANGLALVLKTVGNYEAAQALYRQVLAIREQSLGQEHPDTAQSANNLGMLLHAKGDAVGAERFVRAALSIREATLGPEHPDTATSLDNLAGILRDRGAYESAEDLCRRALAIYGKCLGSDHPDTVICVGNLGAVLRDKGDLSGAETYTRQALDTSERALGSESRYTARCLNDLATVLFLQGNRAVAEALARRSFATVEKALGPHHPETLLLQDNLAEILRSNGDLDDALSLFTRALEAEELSVGNSHPRLIKRLNAIATMLYSKGDYAGAEPYFRRALAVCDKTTDVEDSVTVASLNGLARVLYNQHQYCAAEPLYRRALALDETVYGPAHLETASSLSNLGRVLDGKGEFASAAPAYLRAMQIRGRILGTEHRDVTVAAYSLFSAFFRSGQVADAQKVLSDNLRWLVERDPETLHPDQRRIAEDLKYFRPILSSPHSSEGNNFNIKLE